MGIRVLIVDDSTFFCNRMKKIIDKEPGMEVVALAHNGEEAILKNKELKPDVITMDINMPVMDGITAIKKILYDGYVPIVMISSLTVEGAQETLVGLEAGAVDFFSKASNEEISRDVEQILIDRIRAAYNSKFIEKQGAGSGAENEALLAQKQNFDIVVIGTSTGGPIAIQEIVKDLPGSFPLPIVVVQHMPRNFTSPFAERLNEMTELEVIEAQDGDKLEGGHVYLAPGGLQLGFKDSKTISIYRATTKLTYNPSVDLSFTSAAEVFGGRVLGIILTGMGADGKLGAKAIKAQNGMIWTQDEQSCVVYGMPMVVAQEGLSDRIVNLYDVAKELLQEK